MHDLCKVCLPKNNFLHVGRFFQRRAAPDWSGNHRNIFFHRLCERTQNDNALLLQVSDRSNETFSDWVNVDTQYALQQSLALDLKILFKTPLKVLSSEARVEESMVGVLDGWIVGVLDYWSYIFFIIIFYDSIKVNNSIL